MAYPDIPHLAFPFSRSTDGSQVLVVEQSAADEIMACANVITLCPIGYRADRPEFGWPWPDLKVIPVDAGPLVRALNMFEPRASSSSVDVETMAQAALAIQNIQVDVGIPAADFNADSVDTTLEIWDGGSAGSTYTEIIDGGTA
jgi:phage baseplate assembly protein W